MQPMLADDWWHGEVSPWGRVRDTECIKWRERAVLDLQYILWNFCTAVRLAGPHTGCDALDFKTSFCANTDRNSDLVTWLTADVDIRTYVCAQCCSYQDPNLWPKAYSSSGWALKKKKWLKRMEFQSRNLRLDPHRQSKNEIWTWS